MKAILKTIAILAVVVVRALAATGAEAQAASLGSNETLVFYDYVEAGKLKGGMILRPRQEVKVTMLEEITDQWSVTTVADNGPVEDRIDVVFLGDGYTDMDIDYYATRVDDMVAWFLGDVNRVSKPLDDYMSYFNVHRVDVISNDSCVDELYNGTYCDTALDAYADWDGLYYVDMVKAWSAAAQAPDADQVIVLVPLEGGGTGFFEEDLCIVGEDCEGAGDLLLHEFGHSFGNLADEYDYGDGATFTGSEPTWLLNVSIYDANELLALQRKWYRWLDLPHIDTFEGAQYCEFGIYRPTYESKMRRLDRPFEEVNVEQFIINMYKTVSPIVDSTAESDVPYRTGTSFYVTPMEPVSHELDIQWSVNGINVPGANGVSFTPDVNGLGNRTHEVVVTVVDNTEMVRDETARAQYLTETRRWYINGPIQEAIDASGEGETVVIPQGVYYEQVNLKAKHVTVTSEDPNDPSVVANTVIDGGEVRSAVKFTSGEDVNSVLSGFTITGGNSDEGGGVYCSDSGPRMVKCVIRDNTALYGGGFMLLTAVWCWRLVQSRLTEGLRTAAE